VIATSKLRAWRIQNDLTLEEVGALTGVSIAMLSKAERGLRNLAPLTRVRMARRLGAPLRDLFEVDEISEHGEVEVVLEAIGQV